MFSWNTQHTPNEESRKPCLLTNTGSHAHAPQHLPSWDHISQLLPRHRGLGPPSAGWVKEVSDSVRNIASDTVVANPNFCAENRPSKKQARPVSTAVV